MNSLLCKLGLHNYPWGFKEFRNGYQTFFKRRCRSCEKEQIRSLGQLRRFDP